MIESKNKGASRDDLFSTLYQYKSPDTGQPYGDAELFGEAITLL